MDCLQISKQTTDMMNMNRAFRTLVKSFSLAFIPAPLFHADAFELKSLMILFY